MALKRNQQEVPVYQGEPVLCDFQFPHWKSIDSCKARTLRFFSSSVFRMGRGTVGCVTAFDPAQLPPEGGREIDLASGRFHGCRLGKLAAEENAADEEEESSEDGVSTNIADVLFILEAEHDEGDAGQG